jgi:hypothetical protein
MQLRRVAQAVILTTGALIASAVMPVAAQSIALGQDASSPPLVRQAAAITGLRIESPAFRLVVPFRTQKDGSRWQGSNCGPATLGMLLDGYGLTDQATDDLRVRAHTYQGTLGMRTGTGLDHVAHVAEDLGVSTYGLFAQDGSFRHWSVDDVVAELRQGHPVMPLVRLYLVPGYEGSLPRWGHYILLTGLAPGGGFYFSDSLKTDPAAGTAGIISERQLMAAIENSHIPGQAVAFAGPRDLAVWLPDR